MAKMFFKVAVPIYILPILYDDGFPISLSTLAVCLFHYSHPDGSEEVLNCISLNLSELIFMLMSHSYVLLI